MFILIQNKLPNIAVFISDSFNLLIKSALADLPLKKIEETLSKNVNTVTTAPSHFIQSIPSPNSFLLKHY